MAKPWERYGLLPPADAKYAWMESKARWLDQRPPSRLFVENGPLAEYEEIVWAEEPVVPDPAGRDDERQA